MDAFLKGLISALIFFASTSVVVFLSICIFDLITKYKVWEEIAKGNIAVSFSTGGIVLGVGNIMRFAVASNDTIFATLAWGGIGAFLLLLVYLGFELLTPKLNVSEEIANGNKAVGFIAFIFSLAFSFIIGASIS